MESADEKGQELIERLIGTAEIVEHHFEEGDFDKMISLIHKINHLVRELSPHIQNAKYRKINEDIVANIDELVSAKILGNASPEHFEELVRKNHNAFSAALQ